MALIKLGTGETQPFKKSGGSIIQPSRGGLTLRNAPKFRGKRTPDEWNLNRFLMYATRHWRAMTATQQNNWHSWAATYPQYVERNPTELINGYNLFTKINYYRALHQGPAFSFLTEPAPVYYAIDPVAIKLYWSESGISMSLDFTRGVGDLICFIFVSNVASKGLSFGDTRWRLAVSLPSTDTSVDLTSFFLDNFAKLPEIGQNVFVSVVFIGSNNGQYSFHELSKITVEPSNQYPFGLLYSREARVDERGLLNPDWSLLQPDLMFYMQYYFPPVNKTAFHMMLPSLDFWNYVDEQTDNSSGWSAKGAGFINAFNDLVNFLSSADFAMPATSDPSLEYYARVQSNSGMMLIGALPVSWNYANSVRPCKIDEGETMYIDIDGKNYPLIRIGGYVLTAENLQVTRFLNGDPIPIATTKSEWISLPSSKAAIPSATFNEL